MMAKGMTKQNIRSRMQKVMSLVSLLDQEIPQDVPTPSGT